MTITPRAVLVTRPTEYESLLATHGTRDQASFFLNTRGRSIDEVEARHRRFADARTLVLGAIPRDWRRSEVPRADLDRFLFGPDDIVLALGQDGLVANVAKYLDGQTVIGLNPDPEMYEGILVPHPPAAAADLMRAAAAGDGAVELRTMVEAALDDRQRLVALNEVFIGHRSHQSARYVINVGGTEERQSSSGIVVSTGTGCTGWARSIARERHFTLAMPGPGDPSLAWFVREAWPSVSTQTSLTEGLIRPSESLLIVSQMDDGGVIFGDGIESDFVAFPWGTLVEVRISSRQLRLYRG